MQSPCNRRYAIDPASPHVFGSPQRDCGEYAFPTYQGAGPKTGLPHHGCAESCEDTAWRIPAGMRNT
jgi:hypothetical protein